MKLLVDNMVDALKMYGERKGYDIYEDVKHEFKTNLQNAMGLIGGSITFESPFVIPSPAPYLSSFFGAKTDCN